MLKAIVELRRNGLFGCALIKKRKYWPKHVPGDAMRAFFDADGIQVSDFNAVTGRLDGIDYNIWVMKDPDYVMKLMSCGGPLLSKELQGGQMNMAGRWGGGGTLVTLPLPI